MDIESANNVDLHLLRCFETLMTEQSVSRAAIKMGLSQPAMSHALNKLRLLFNDQLLIKARAGMTPTSRATLLEPQVRDLIASAYRLIEQPTGFAAHESTKEFKVMTAEYTEYLLLPGLMKRLRSEAPLVRVSFRSAQRERALEWLERGELDFRFGWWPESPPTLRVKRLFRDPLVCIARLGHPQIDGNLTEEQFIGTPHAALRERMGIAVQAVEHAVAARHRHLNVQYQVQNALTLCNAVANSDLIGTLPERFATALALKYPIQVLPIPIAVVDVRQAMYWHEATHKSPAHVWFRQLIAELVRTL